MNTKEAYRQLDLAQGLDFERTKSQYETLKTELNQKISGTSNAVLKDVYLKRLQEVEQAFSVLDDHLNTTASAEESTETETIVFSEEPKSNANPVKKKLDKANVKLIAMIGGGIVAIVLVFSLFWSSEDPFRIREGEQQIFVGSLNLREYPQDGAYKIGSFSTGTRFVYDSEEEPVYSSSYTWRKVNVIHPVNGWGSDERPNPYSGWMATASCGIPWVADSLKTKQLQQIFDNNSYITSSYRHKLVEYFNDMNYLDEWVVPAENDENSYKPVVARKYGLSEKDCKNIKQKDLFVVLRNRYSYDQKILIMYLDGNGDAQIHWDMDFPGENFEIIINRRNRVYLNRTNPSSEAKYSGDEIWFDDDAYYIYRK